MYFIIILKFGKNLKKTDQGVYHWQLCKERGSLYTAGDKDVNRFRVSGGQRANVPIAVANIHSPYYQASF